MKSKTVTIVIPVYNHESFLERCIESAVSQTYDDLEIIIIDDGSTDNSVRVIERIIEGKKNILFESQSNKGAHYTINRAIAMSSGRYINIINSDDYMSERRIERLIDIAMKDNIRFIFTRVGYVDDKNRDITFNDPFCYELFQKQSDIAKFPTVGYSLLMSNVSISTGNMFFEKRLYDDVGGFRDYKYVHDWDFILRCLLHTEPFYLDESHYFYRIHDRNSFKSLQSVAKFEGPEILKKYFALSKYFPVKNSIAPTRANWPFFFEYFIKKNKRWDYYCK